MNNSSHAESNREKRIASTSTPRKQPEGARVWESAIPYLEILSEDKLLENLPDWFKSVADPLVKEDMLWAVKAWRCVYTALTMGMKHCPHPWDSPARGFVENYAKRLREGTAITWLKTHLAYTFAYGTNQEELPIFPSDELDTPGIFAGGWVYKRITRLLAQARSGKRKAQNLLWSLFQCKIGMPCITESFVDTTLDKHAAGLVGRRIKEEDVQVRLDKDRVKSTILDFVSNAFNGARLSGRVNLPSLSAGLKFARCGASLAGVATGGNLGFLLRRFYECKYPEDTLAGSRWIDVLLSQRSCSVTEAMSEVCPGLVVDHRQPPSSDLLGEFLKFVEEGSCEEIAYGRLPVGVVLIKEPLKGRPISKGPSFTYYKVLEIQKMMWETLRRIPYFRYIGQPIDEADFSLTFSGRLSGPESRFVSGDYSQATDNLDPELSEWTWKCIAHTAELCPDLELYYTDFYTAGKKALTGHYILYPDEKGQYGTCCTPGQEKVLDCRCGKQVWGQLMGSPMSFPILCIINFCATCTAMGWDPNSIGLPIRVNGDDIAFVYDRKEQYAEWSRIVSSCGLAKSIGKNYTSRDFLVMNSELRWYKEGTASFVIDPDDNCAWCPDTWEFHGFLNQGILWGTVHKGMDAGNRQWLVWPEIGPMMWSLVRGFPESEAASISYAYRRIHALEMSKIPYRCPYALPLALGGAGLPPMGLPEPTVLEMKQAANLYMNPEIRLRQPVVKRKQDPMDRFLKDSRKRLSVPLGPLRRIRKDELHTQTASSSMLEDLLEASPLLDLEWEPDPTEPLGQRQRRLKQVGGGRKKQADGHDHDLAAQCFRQWVSLTATHNMKWRRWLKHASETSLSPIGLRKALCFVERWTREVCVGTPDWRSLRWNQDRTVGKVLPLAAYGEWTIPLEQEPERPVNNGLLDFWDEFVRQWAFNPTDLPAEYAVPL